jgi:hypothetical protein
MKIRMQYSECSDNLTFESWDISFIGDPIDDRGKKSIEFVIANSKDVRKFEYNSNDFTIILAGSEFYKDDLDNELHSLNELNILIDSTTLSFSEILIITQSLKNVGVNHISILYIEPCDYKKKHRNIPLLNKRDFELSESINGYSAIPGHALLISNEITQKIVFLCGYEAERIDRAFEDSQLNSSNCSCVFGVPAFCPGWEMNTFDNNIPVIKERKIKGDVHFCGATNPLAIYQTLCNIYESLGDDDQMLVVPLATKPMSIGACLFLVEKPKDRVAVLYDHPKEIKGRALKISNWHLFNITIN